MKITLFSLVLFAGLFPAARPQAQENPENGIYSGEYGADDTGLAPAAQKPAVAPPTPVKKWKRAKPATLAPKEWTMLLFVNGKGNLYTDQAVLLDDLADYGSTDRVNVVVEYGQLGQGVARLALRSRNRDGIAPNEPLRKIEAGGYPYIKSKAPQLPNVPENWLKADIPLFKNPAYSLIDTLPYADMGDWKEAANFISWAKTEFPARHYLFMIWNHGGGWRGISFDDETGNRISAPQFAKVLAKAGPVDIIFSFACLMQTAEVAYELAPYTKAIIASEDISSTMSWSARAILKHLDANPGAEPFELARLIIGDYGKFLRRGIWNESRLPDMPYQQTMSLVDPRAIVRLPAMLRAWTRAVMAAGDKEAAVAGMAGALHMAETMDDTWNYADLGDFVDNVSHRSDSAEVREKGKALYDAITGRIVPVSLKLKGFSGTETERVTGLSIELPGKASRRDPDYRDEIARDYSKLKFAESSGWDKFLFWMLDARDAELEAPARRE